MPFDLAEQFVLSVEQELGAALPAAYRVAMLRRNGGELAAGDDDWQQYPIADTSDRKRLSRTTNHILKETQEARAWPSFPAGALAIAGNGAGDQLVLLRQGNAFSPAVYVWSHETGHLQEVASDFSKLQAP